MIINKLLVISSEKEGEEKRQGFVDQGMQAKFEKINEIV
jgi:hypothetical protein